MRALALAHAPTAVGTVGQVEVKPNSPNVVPGQVRMTVDLRHHDDAVLDAMEADLKAAVEGAASEEKVAISLSKLHDLAAIKFHPECIAAVRGAARRLAVSARIARVD